MVNEAFNYCMVVKRAHLSALFSMPIIHIYYLFWMGISLLIEFKTLFLKRLNFWIPLDVLITVLILLFVESIGPLDTLLPSILMNEFLISSCHLTNVLPNARNSPKVLFLNSSIRSSNASSQVWWSAVKLNSRYLSFNRYARVKSSSIDRR